MDAEMKVRRVYLYSRYSSEPIMLQELGVGQSQHNPVSIFPLTPEYPWRGYGELP